MLDGKQRRRAQELHDTAVALGARCAEHHKRSFAHKTVVGKAAPGDLHPGWPAGTPGGLGGKFMPTNVSAALDTIPANSPKRPAPALDSDGNPIVGDGDKPLLRPADLPPAFFVEQGLALKKRLVDAAQLGGDAVSMEITAGLARFGRGGAWDAQRVQGEYVDEYRDYATVAIGLYCAAAGIPRDTCLSIQNTYAILSKFPKSEKKDDTYWFLPERNVRNTDRGYALYESGKVTTGP